MLWAIFVWGFLPAGAVLVALLLSSTRVFMSTASLFLQTPIKVGTNNFKMRLNLASTVTAFCCLLSVVCYGSCKSQEARLDMAMGLPDRFVQEQSYRNVFHAERNLYIALLGLSLWATAWRLDALYRLDILKLPKAPTGGHPVARRMAFGVLGVVFLLLTDVPLCRLNYNFQLKMFVTPKKDQLLQSFPSCNDVYLGTAAGHGEVCKTFCDEALQLAKDRQWFIHWARGWHVMGRLSAQLFDEMRDVKQDDSRIENLFQTRTCALVLFSVDKSNTSINVICYFLAALGGFGFLWAASESLFGDSDVPVPPPIDMEKLEEEMTGKVHTN